MALLVSTRGDNVHARERKRGQVLFLFWTILDIQWRGLFPCMQSWLWYLKSWISLSTGYIAGALNLFLTNLHLSLRI